MPHVTSSDGLKIWYDVVGTGDPLVLIGGSSLVHNQWDFMMPNLMKELIETLICMHLKMVFMI